MNDYNVMILRLSYSIIGIDIHNTHAKAYILWECTADHVYFVIIGNDFQIILVKCSENNTGKAWQNI